MKLDYAGNTQWAHIAATEYNSYSKSLAIRGDEVAVTGQCGPLYWSEANNTEALTESNTNDHLSRFDKNSGDLIALDSISSLSGIIDTEDVYAFGDCTY